MQKTLSFCHKPWSLYLVTLFSNSKEPFFQNKFPLGALDIKNLDLHCRNPLVYHVVDTYVSLSVWSTFEYCLIGGFLRYVHISNILTDLLGVRQKIDISVCPKYWCTPTAIA